MANETKALVTAETQGAAEFCACQTVHCAIYWAVWRAAVGSFDKKKERKDTGKDKTECNEDNKQLRANKMQLLKKKVTD